MSSEMIDLIRSIMYAGEDGTNDEGNGGSLLLAEVEDLARMLGEYDGVPYDGKMASANRLILMLKALKHKKPKCFRRLERINGE